MEEEDSLPKDGFLMKMAFGTSEKVLERMDEKFARKIVYGDETR